MKFRFLVSYCALIHFASGNTDYLMRLNERGPLMEGDMMLSFSQTRKLYSQEKELETNNRNVLREQRWQRAVVPYVITGSFNIHGRQAILRGMRMIQNVSCVKFVRRKAHRDYIRIDNSQAGCWSQVGREGGQQYVNLAHGCVYPGIVAHELLHTLGLYHQQSSYDRDGYIQILWKNIQPSARSNFNKYSKRVTTNFGLPYDYHSIMHYGEDAFTINGQATMKSIKRGIKVGTRHRLTKYDVAKVNKMYNCKMDPEPPEDDTDENEDDDDIEENGDDPEYDY